MPFKKGNTLASNRKGKRKEQPKTIWLLQSLAENGVNLQSLLASSIIKASHGDRQAMDLAHLLTKLLPLVSNAPKQDVGMTQIETLVINRYDAAQTPQIEPAIETELVEPEDPLV